MWRNEYFRLVELFAVGNFVEHYTQAIMNTLYDMSYFEKKRSVMSQKSKRGRRNEILTDSDSESEEDIDDGWRCKGDLN